MFANHECDRPTAFDGAHSALNEYRERVLRIPPEMMRDLRTEVGRAIVVSSRLQSLLTMTGDMRREYTLGPEFERVLGRFCRVVEDHHNCFCGPLPLTTMRLYVLLRESVKFRSHFHPCLEAPYSGWLSAAVRSLLPLMVADLPIEQGLRNKNGITVKQIEALPANVVGHDADVG